MLFVLILAICFSKLPVTISQKGKFIYCFDTMCPVYDFYKLGANLNHFVLKLFGLCIDCSSFVNYHTNRSHVTAKRYETKTLHTPVCFFSAFRIIMI